MQKTQRQGLMRKPREAVMLVGLIVSRSESFVTQPGPKDVPWDGATRIGLGPPTTANN